MKMELVITDDGSSSIYLPDLDERYHSSHGAIQEATHVFIENGLKKAGNPVKIFELGFGTGLNALLSLKYSHTFKKSIYYDTIEAYPIESDIIEKLNYSKLIGHECGVKLKKFHESGWSETVKMTDNFVFQKFNEKIEVFNMKFEYYNLIYFDAFGPRVQSELWQKNILKKMFDSLVKGGCLVTYCAQGQFKRDLKNVGFVVNVLPGPPGKREMTEAIKP